MQKNNNENRYGNLLDKYMDGGNEKKSYSSMLNQQVRRNQEKGETRYGDLLKNAKPNNKIYDDILNVHNASIRCRQNKAEQERQDQLKRQERIDREQRELQERIDRNDAFVNDMLEKKRAEQAAIEKRKKKRLKRLIFIRGWRDWRILILTWQRYILRHRASFRIMGHIGYGYLVCPIFYLLLRLLLTEKYCGYFIWGIYIVGT